MSVTVTAQDNIWDIIAQIYYVKPDKQTGKAFYLTKDKGINDMLYVCWKDGVYEKEKIIQEIGEKVVLVWE